jgi:hypothetical protein
VVTLSRIRIEGYISSCGAGVVSVGLRSQSTPSGVVVFLEKKIRIELIPNMVVRTHTMFLNLGYSTSFCFIQEHRD